MREAWETERCRAQSTQSLRSYLSCMRKEEQAQTGVSLSCPMIQFVGWRFRIRRLCKTMQWIGKSWRLVIMQWT